MFIKSLKPQYPSVEGVTKLRGILGDTVSSLGMRIVGGEWLEGEVMPKEADFIEELGVSRSVIRESFKILVAKGLISTRPSDGTRVMPRNQWRLLDPDVIDWRILSGNTESLLNDLLNLRLVIEPGVIYNATLNATSEDKERVKKAWEEKERTHNDNSVTGEENREKYIEADLAFHKAFISTTGSEMLEQIFSIIQSALGLLFDLQMRAKGYVTEMVNMEESQVLHENVYKAFMEGDSLKAEQAMRKLIIYAISDAKKGLKLSMSV